MLAVCLKPLKYTVAASVIALALAGLFGVGSAMAGIRVYNPTTGQNEAASDDGMVDAPTAAPAVGGVRVPTIPEPAVDPQTKAQQQAAREQNCQLAKQRLSQLENHPRIRYKAADGSVRVMSEEEKQAKLMETRKMMDEMCQ